MGAGPSTPSSTYSNNNVTLLTAKAINKNSAAILGALDTLFSAPQKAVCKNHYGDIVEFINLIPAEGTPMKTQDSIDFILALLKNSGLSLVQGEPEWLASDKRIIYDALITSLPAIVNANSVNGMVTPVVVKQNMLDVFKSICPNGDATKKTNFMDTLAESDVMSQSSFGSSVDSMNWYIIILVVLILLAAYYYFNKKRTAKLSLPQQIAQFGRTIRSIRKI